MPVFSVNRRLSVAPMMDRSDRNFRLMVRLITRETWVYTEMITTRALLSELAGPYQNPVNPAEHPVALQLGGDDPAALAECSKIAQDLGYDEVNLNVGCPSSRVQQGRIGAILMRDPQHVAECLAAMQSNVKIPVTVKHRLGIDEDPDEVLERFVEVVAQSGVRHFTVHARKAWLQGLSPKENRHIPPLRYDLVHAIAKRRPDLHFEINGGIANLDDCETQMRTVSSVMMGRAVWDNPMLLAAVDHRFCNREEAPLTPAAVATALLPWIQETIAQGRAWSFALRPILNLFHGRPGGRGWRRILSEGAANPNHHTLEGLVEQALREVAPS